MDQDICYEGGGEGRLEDNRGRLNLVGFWVTIVGADVKVAIGNVVGNPG